MPLVKPQWNLLMETTKFILIAVEVHDFETKMLGGPKQTRYSNESI